MHELLNAFVASQQSPRTAKTYAHVLGKFVTFLAGQEATPALVDNWRTVLLHSGLSPASVNLHVAALRAFAAWVEYTQGVVLPRPRGVKVEAPIPDLPSDEVIAAAEAELRGPQEIAIWYVLKSSGVRVSELVALRVEDVDLPKRRLKVREGKGGKPRIAFISQYACDALSGLLRGRTSGWVFQGHRNHALTARAVEYLFQRLSNQVGFRLHPHGLRHLRATTIVAKTGDIAAAQIALGHASVQTTQRYVHLALDPVQEKLETTF